MSPPALPPIKSPSAPEERVGAGLAEEDLRVHVVDPDHEGFVEGRSQGVGDADHDVAARALLEVEQDPIRDRDLAGDRINREAAAGAVGQRVGEDLAVGSCPVTVPTTVPLARLTARALVRSLRRTDYNEGRHGQTKG
jgi:hypothetical protein